MTKIIEIENCDDCPYYRMSTKFGSYCNRIGRGISGSGRGISKKCTLSDKLKISMVISNATSLPYGDEEHISSAYLRSEDIVKVKFQKSKLKEKERRNGE